MTDQTNETKTTTPSRAQIIARLGGSADHVTKHKDGTFTARRTFFYRNGMSAERFETSVRALLPEARIIESGETWRAWPAESYWFVRFAPVSTGAN